MRIRIRDTEGCERQPLLLWDSVWIQRLDASGGYADWLLAGEDDQPESRGGLRSEQAIHTATLLSLFTDARAPDGTTLPTDDGDRRGWWGDSVRLDDEPERGLGSLLWLEIERAALSVDTATRVRVACEEALSVLLDQGVVAETVVETEVDSAQGFLGIRVQHFSHARAKVYDQRFDVLWQQVPAARQMTFGDQGAFG